MAETLSFSSGNFNLADTDGSGSEKLAVDDKGGGEFLLSNNDGSKIVGLGIQADNEPLKLEFVSNEGTTLKKATINLGDKDDILIISGKTKKSDLDAGNGKDEAESSDIFKDSELDMGAGKDKAEFSEDDGNFALNGSFIDMGAGNDRVEINGGVKDSEIDLGKGSDTLIFGGDIKDTTVNLGSDGNSDVIRIAKGVEIQGLKIVGADEGDVLFIGSTEYQYNAVNNSWVNGDEEIKF